MKPDQKMGAMAGGDTEAEQTETGSAEITVSPELQTQIDSWEADKPYSVTLTLDADGNGTLTPEAEEAEAETETAPAKKWPGAVEKALA